MSHALQCGSGPTGSVCAEPRSRNIVSTGSVCAESRSRNIVSTGSVLAESRSRNIVSTQVVGLLVSYIDIWHWTGCGVTSAIEFWDTAGCWVARVVSRLEVRAGRLIDNTRDRYDTPPANTYVHL